MRPSSRRHVFGVTASLVIAALSPAIAQEQSGAAKGPENVSVGRVTDEAHFTNDLGADWLDRLDLMIAVEDQFAGVEITDDDVDRIELVGDLIRHIETLDSERRRRGDSVVLDPEPSPNCQQPCPSI
jgi:acyl carrier protein